MDKISIKVRDGILNVNGTNLGLIKGPIDIVVDSQNTRNINSSVSVTILGDVQGYVRSEGSVRCENVGQYVKCDGSLTCDNIGGAVSAGGSIKCANVTGSMTAGGSISCR